MSSDDFGPAKLESAHDRLRRVTVGAPARIAGPIVLDEYSDQWPELFEAESARISAALGASALQLEHVGSTSVPGLAAKPIIDICLVVEDSADEAAYLPKLSAAGYALRVREEDWQEHRMFKGPATDINLHVFSAGSPEVRRMLAFRDRLCGDGAARHWYERIKRELAHRHWTYVQDYADAKSAVVEAIMGGEPPPPEKREPR